LLFSGVTRFFGLNEGFPGFWGFVPLVRAFGPGFGFCAAI
jgi:hypothetical protein